MNDITKFGLSKAYDGKKALANVDQVFNLLDDKRIDYKKFSDENLGIYSGALSDDNHLLYMDTTPDDLLSLESDYNYKFIINNPTIKNAPLFFVGVKNCKKGDFRGEVKYLPPKAIHLVQSSFVERKTIVPEHLPMIFKNGSYQCILSEIDQSKKSAQLDEVLNVASMNTLVAVCLAWEQYFLWRVRVKMPEWRKSVDFNINPADVKRVFKLRDIADGEQRRKALKHIVHSHERQLKSGEKIEILRYLRGKEKFTQSGYEITVIPSKDDIKTLEDKLNK